MGRAHAGRDLGRVSGVQGARIEGAQLTGGLGSDADQCVKLALVKERQEHNRNNSFGESEILSFPRRVAAGDLGTRVATSPSQGQTPSPKFRLIFFSRSKW